MDVLAQASDGVWSQWMWPLLQFVIGLGLVVFVHELGHFLAAKWAGVRVEKFALGFGPKLLSLQRGETLYCLNAIPLGGYVSMTGQEDLDPAAAAPDDPRSWQRARYSRRLVILAAGVAMNVVFAALVFVIVYMVGIRFTAPVIGDVVPDSPAAKAAIPDEVARLMPEGQKRGLRPGDDARAINGERARQWEDLAEAAVLSSHGESFRLTIERQIAGEAVTFDTVLTPEEVKDATFGRHYAFGIEPAASNLIRTPGVIGYAGAERLSPEDRIVAVAGEPAENSWDMPDILNALPSSGAVSVAVLRKGQRAEVSVTQAVLSQDRNPQDLLNLAGLLPRMSVARVLPRSPAAKAGVEPGDLIAEYGGLADPTRRQLGDVSAEHLDQEAVLKLRRDDHIVETLVRPKDVDGKAVLGLTLLPETAAPFVAGVSPDSPAARAGVKPGAVVTAVNGKPVSTWIDVYYAFKGAGDEEITLTLTKDGQEHPARLGKLTREEFDATTYSIVLPAVLTSDQYYLQTDLIRGHPGLAIKWAVKDTVRFLRNVYASLRQMVTGRVGLKGVQGPAGIGQFAVLIARESSLKLVYFMAMLSVMVAAFNFLPLPVLDGGHVVLVTIEKLRGRALPVKLIARIQQVGLVALLGLFLLVTWQDLVRMIGW